jgi:hypothetical protein
MRDLVKKQATEDEFHQYHVLLQKTFNPLLAKEHYYYLNNLSCEQRDKLNNPKRDIHLLVKDLPYPTGMAILMMVITEYMMNNGVK